VMVLASPVPLKNLDGAFSHASDGMAAGTQAGVELLAAATDVPSCRTRGFKRVTDDDCRPRTRGLILPEAETTKQHTVSLSVAARASDPFVFVPFEFEHVKKQ